MKRKSLKENYNTLAKSNDFGRVLLYIGDSVALYLGECFILESTIFSLLFLC